MGAAASTGVAAATSSASPDELKSTLEGLPADVKQKLLAALSKESKPDPPSEAKPSAALPKCIEIFYNQLLSNTGNPEAEALAKEAFHEDWNTRPNPHDPEGGGKMGENWHGCLAIPKVLALWGKQMSGFKMKILACMECSDGWHAVVSNVSATCTGETLEGMPHFLGLTPENLKDKSIGVMAIDLHQVVDGKIKKSYHGEDWMDAMSQILATNGRKGPSTLDHGDLFTTRGTALTEVPHLPPLPLLPQSRSLRHEYCSLSQVPKCIDIFYDQLLSNTGNPEAESLVKEAFHEDWNTRPNPLDPEGGGKMGENWPGSMAVPKVLASWGKEINELKFARQLNLISGDKVVVVSKASGTCTGEAPSSVFPGLSSEQLKDKKFETLAIDAHKIVDGKIKASYHYEAWFDAMCQIKDSKAPPMLDLPK
ncbi:MAG: hypothetical protein SGPRY_001575 [Prymnesium sp.]